ncbi:hypothetical protein TIFTF001_054298 [Ficus carica]|uniref:Uncharacterized protein n=1 Tax=Ficus carica TaxID=3494 RepID=A0AA88JI29_FICCA|nr:hypothetical protein TIFTF001_054298 [Ficus carica]
MWRRGRLGTRRRNVGRITQYFQARKSARRPFNSCPNPPIETGTNCSGWVFLFDFPPVIHVLGFGFALPFFGRDG